MPDANGQDFKNYNVITLTLKSWYVIYTYQDKNTDNLSHKVYEVSWKSFDITKTSHSSLSGSNLYNLLIPSQLGAKHFFLRLASGVLEYSPFLEFGCLCLEKKRCEISLLSAIPIYTEHGRILGSILVCETNSWMRNDYFI